MGFLEWLFGRKKAGVDKEMLFYAQELRDEYDRNVSEIPDLKRVPKWFHAKKNGRRITCPKCRASTIVYNFSWTALACPHCKKETGKYDWFLGPGDE